MKFTYFGHACFHLELNGTKFLIDPFITPVGNDKTIDISSIQADYILISHGHEDHIADAILFAHQTQATVIANPEVLAWIEKQGYSKVHPMNFGTREFEFGKLHFVPAQHSSGLPDGSYGGQPGGFIINTPKGVVYYSGDTSLTMEMQLIPRYAKIDVAILPIGGNFTMNPEEAVIANEMIQAKHIIGVHFDTFGYIKIDHEWTKELFQKNNIPFILPSIGEIIELPLSQ